MKNNGSNIFHDFPRLPSLGWEVFYPPPKVICEYTDSYRINRRPEAAGDTPIEYGSSAQEERTIHAALSLSLEEPYRQSHQLEN